MEGIVSIVIFLVLITFIFFKRGLFNAGKINNVASLNKDKYLKKVYFFSIAEKKFFDELSKTVSKKFIIFSKVRVADLLFVGKDGNGKKSYGSFNKIKAKHIDFVIVRGNDFSIVCGIELDDKSHLRSDRVKRDIFLNDAFEGAGLPLIRFKCKSAYSNVEIKKELVPYL
jgi:hypothetical protein